MKKSQRLQVVVDLAQREEEKTAQQFKAMQNAFAAEQQRLHDLEKYYKDYEAAFVSKTQGLRASELSNARALLQQLVLVQQGQQAQLEQARQAMEAAKQIWHKTHLKHEKLQELMLRYRRDENLALDKQEQKLVDEWVSQTYAQSRYL